MKPPTNPNDVEDHNRMMLAVILCLIILLGYQFFFAKPPPPPEQPQTAAQQAAPVKPADTTRPRSTVIAEGKRIPIKGDKVTGSLSLKGLRLDDLLLNDQYVTVEHKELVPLLNPSGTPGAFYEESGWIAVKEGTAVPSQDTVWTVESGSPSEITSGGAPIKMKWDNGAGLVFEREISLDNNYLFTVTERVTNKTSEAVTFNPYHLVARTGMPPDYRGMYVLHEGPIARLDSKGYEPQYKKLISGDKIEDENVQGWIGITDKYWMATLLPDPAQKFNARIMGTSDNGVQHFQTDIVDTAITVAPHQSAENTTHLYAGVKTLDIINAYKKKYGFEHLDYAIDFGIYYLIVKPYYYVFHFIAQVTGNIGLTILLMTLLVRGLMFPLATKSYTSMAKMKKVGPLLKEIQEKYKDDKAKMQMEIMELYKREDANPFSGCLPMFVQIPVFFALYKVILISIELRQAPFWGWIHDLSAPDPTTIFNLFGLIPWNPPSALMIGGWPIIFCLTMILQKRLTPPLPDPVQEKMQSYFPWFFTVMMAHFAVGLVIYWAWSNTLAVLQQYYILKKVGGEDVSLLRGHHMRRKKKA